MPLPKPAESHVKDYVGAPAESGPADLLEYFFLAAEGIAVKERNQVADEAFMDRFQEARERTRSYFERR